MCALEAPWQPSQPTPPSAQEPSIPGYGLKAPVLVLLGPVVWHL